jgi:hypothetical protein
VDSRADTEDDDERLRRVVEEAIPRMEYGPGLRQERPVAAWVRLEFVFRWDRQETSRA